MALKSREFLESLAEPKLLDLILQGDRDAVSHLLLIRCGPGLKYLVGQKYPTLNLDLNDLVSEVYLALSKNSWRALERFRGANRKGQSCSLVNYIFCIASRLLWQKMDRRMKEKRWLDTLDHEGVHTGNDELRQSLQRSDALILLEGLKDPVDRAVIMLYKIEERNVNEVAAMLNTSVGNVYTRCSRALTELRGLLEKGGS